MQVDESGAPWPYEHIEPLGHEPEPTWECPEGFCTCAKAAGTHKNWQFSVMLCEPDGTRMRGARCRVVINGILANVEDPYADAEGWITVACHHAPSSVYVEWAPTETPLRAPYPHRRRYFVDLRLDDANQRLHRRLHNLGFYAQPTLRENIEDFHAVYGRRDEDVDKVLEDYHDRAMVPIRRTGAPDRSDEVRLVSAPVGESQVGASPSGAQPPQPPSTPTKDKGHQKVGQGTVVPDVGDVFLVVSLDPSQGALNPSDITARLRPLAVPSMSPAQHEIMIKPSAPGTHWDVYEQTQVAFSFRDVPVGRYTALAHIDNVQAARVKYAIGSAEVEVKTGLRRACHVAAKIDRPIVTVADPLLDLDVPVMQRRRKVLATVFKQFPQSADFQANAKGIVPPYDQGTYKPMYAWKYDPKNPDSCTPINNNIMKLAGSSLGHFGTDIPKSPGFVAYAGALVPSVGDSIYLTGANDDEFHHCGIVVQSSLISGEVWLTADGGQPDRTSEFEKRKDRWGRYWGPPPSFQAAYIVPRLFSKVGSSVALIGNRFAFPTRDDAFGYRMKGWVDITHPKVLFSKPGYDANGSEADYRALKKRALAMPALVQADRERCQQKQQSATPGAPPQVA